MIMNTCDLYDAHLEQLQVCNAPLISYGGAEHCHGQIVTVKCYQDNSQVKELLNNSQGIGKVLVVDGGGSTEYALLGDLIAAAAVKNQWQGMIFNAAVRDIGALAALDIHIKALGNIPRKTDRQGQGIIGIPIYFGMVNFVPGHWLYSDGEGLVTSAKPLSID